MPSRLHMTLTLLLSLTSTLTPALAASDPWPAYTAVDAGSMPTQPRTNPGNYSISFHTSTNCLAADGVTIDSASLPIELGAQYAFPQGEDAYLNGGLDPKDYKQINSVYFNMPLDSLASLQLFDHDPQYAGHLCHRSGDGFVSFGGNEPRSGCILLEIPALCAQLTMQGGGEGVPAASAVETLPAVVGNSGTLFPAATRAVGPRS